MSIIGFPRLLIMGEMSFDPGLSNNFEVYDQLNVALKRTALQAVVPGVATLEQEADRARQRGDGQLHAGDRDLSRGKRRLLERWCDLVIAGTASREPAPPRPVNARTMSQRVFPEET